MDKVQKKTQTKKKKKLDQDLFSGDSSLATSSRAFLMTAIDRNNQSRLRRHEPLNRRLLNNAQNGEESDRKRGRRLGACNAQWTEEKEGTESCWWGSGMMLGV